MSDFSFLKVDSCILEKLAGCSIKGLTPDLLLTYTANTLVHVSDLTREEAELVLKTAAEKHCKLAPPTAWSILQGESPQWIGSVRHVSTGCRALDTFLRGGIPFRGLFEVCGESSAGKTQLVLQLCLTVQLHQEGSGRSSALFISTEDAFPHNRLAQLARHFSYGHGHHGWMDNIYVEHALTYEDLDKLVSHRLPNLIARKRVRLVVLDSIAAVARAEFGLGNEAERAQCLCSLALQLRNLSVESGVAVVIVNQVSAAMDAGPGAVQPALGLTWSDMVTTRVLLSRSAHTEAAEPQPLAGKYPTVLRKLRVVFCPYLPNDVIHFVVEERGLRGLELSRDERCNDIP